MSANRVWLDAAAGQPLSPAAARVLGPAAAATWSLPLGVHSEAAKARAVRDAAIEQLATAWGVARADVIPVNGLAQACFYAARAIGQPIRTAASARQSQLAATTGAERLAVDTDGRVDLAHIPATGWLGLQAGNPELGAIEDFAAVRAAAPDTSWLVDASEWMGRLPGLPPGEVLLVRAAAWAGPASVCFVVDRDGRLSPGTRERQLLAPDPAMLAAAAEAWTELGDIAERAARQRAWLAELAGRLAAIERVAVQTVGGERLPHLLAFSVAAADSEAVAAALDRLGFAVGAGSACVSDGVESSHVLAATGRPGNGLIRIGLPLTATAEQLQQFAAALPEAVARL